MSNTTACPHADATTIQAGVDMASARDTVRVCRGTYAGGITINTAGLKLQAVGFPGSVVIAGTGASGPLFGIDVIADRVTITGFEIRGFAAVHDAFGIFVGGTFAGDTAHPANGADIKLNNIHDNGNGVYLWQSNGNDVEHNTIPDNKDVDGTMGVGVSIFSGFGDDQTAAANASGQSGRGNDISDNVLSGNDRLAVFAGACTEAAFGCVGPVGMHADISGTTIDHNVAYGNGAHGTEAIGLLDAHGGTIAHNVVFQNAYHGIYVNFSDRATVASNVASDNSTAAAGYAGIRLNGAGKVMVDDNTMNGNGAGIRVTTSTGDVFVRNVARSNSVFDLDWDGAGTHTFVKNRCGTANPSKAAWDCH